MKLSKKYQYNTICFLNESIQKECLFCKSKNILNGVCLDCKNKGGPIYYIERKIQRKTHSLRLSFSLTARQKEASLFFLSHYKRKENASLLAVCGSGKTEIMYETILYALNEHKKVLFALPRKEIARELFKRLTKAFPDTLISFLDASHHNDEGEIVVSTINQLLYYEEEFDLAILDEADAYPYNNSLYLKRLFKKAVKKNGVSFTMSATTHKSTKEDIYCLGKRYHGYPLPSPTFIKVKDDKLAVLKEIIKKENARSTIVFVSSVKKALYLSKELGYKACYADNENTGKNIDDLKTGKEKCIISTTVLERGITINRLNIVIYDGEDAIYNKETIIQICGRVGRSKDDPYGNAYIFYTKNKLAFILAKKYFKRMNS